MVTRYDLDRYNPDGAEIEVYAGGGYVRYADYEALDKDFQDYITATEMELKELRAKLGLSN